MRKIIQNEVKCTLCDDIIYSGDRHDFKYCKCGNIAVDGGMAYLRRMGNGIANGTVIDRSMGMEEQHLKNVIAALEWANDNGRNNLGAALAVIRSLREDGLLDMSKFNPYDDRKEI
jgi:hypothetical protein